MKKTILLGGAAIMLFAAGIGNGWLLFHREKEEVAEPEIRIRVADGNVEWSTGGEWSQAGTLAQLQEGDPYAARASWGEYPAAENAASAFAIGEVPKAEEPASRPSTPTKRPSRPSGSGNTGGNSGGSGTTQPPTTPSNPQDGEDVGWSDDLL